MKKYKLKLVPTKQGAFVRRRIDATRSRAELVGMFYLIATVVISVLAGKTLIAAEPFAGGVRHFYKVLLAHNYSTVDDLVTLGLAVLYGIMLVVLVINFLRALTHLKYLFKTKVSRIYGLNSNISAMEALGGIFSGSLVTIIITHFIIYMACPGAKLVDAAYYLGAIGLGVHILCGFLGSKVSAFYIDDEKGVREVKRPYGRIMPLIRNVLQVAAVFAIGYIILKHSGIHLMVSGIAHAVYGGDAKGVLADILGLVPVALEVVSVLCLFLMIIHAFGTCEYSIEGPKAPGIRNFRIASILLFLISAALVVFRYFVGGIETFAANPSGGYDPVAVVKYLDKYTLVIAAIALVMVAVDFLFCLRWTKAAQEEYKEEMKGIYPPAPRVEVKLPAIKPAPVNVHVPRQQAPEVNVNVPELKPEISVNVPQQKLPPINVHVPRQHNEINVHVPKQIPEVTVNVPELKPEVNVHVPKQEVAPVNVYVPKQDVAPITVKVPKLDVTPITVNVPKQDVAPITVKVPKQDVAPITVKVPKLDVTPVTVNVPKQDVAPITVKVPKQDVAPITVKVPKLDVTPVTVNVPQQEAAPVNVYVPQQEVAPITVKVPKQDVAPIMVKVPKLDVTPITVNVPQQEVAPITVKVPKLDVTPITVNVPQQEVAPITVKVPQQEVAPITVNVPKQETAPITVKVPKLDVTPVTVNVPQQEVAPITVKVPKQEAAPITVNVPQQEIAPITLKVPKQEVAPIMVKVPKQEATPIMVNVPQQEVTPITVNVPQQEVAPITVKVPKQEAKVTPIEVTIPSQDKKVTPIEVNVPANDSKAEHPITIMVPEGQTATPIHVNLPEQKASGETIVMVPVSKEEGERLIKNGKPVVAVETNGKEAPATVMAVPSGDNKMKIVMVPTEKQETAPVNVTMPPVYVNVMMPEQKPVEQKPVEQQPINVTVNVPEQKPVEQKPVEQKPVEQKPVEQQPVEQKPVEQKPEQQPINVVVNMPEQKPVEQQPINVTVNVPEQKPVEQQPINVTVNVPEQQPVVQPVAQHSGQGIIYPQQQAANQRPWLQPIYIPMAGMQTAPAQSTDNIPVATPIETNVASIAPELPPVQEEVMREPRDWEIRCPNCGKGLKVNDRMLVHRCPSCTKVFRLDRGTRPVKSSFQKRMEQGSPEGVANLEQRMNEEKPEGMAKKLPKKTPPQEV